MKKKKTIFSNYLHPLLVKLMFQNTSATFFHNISLWISAFLEKIQELRKRLFFEVASEIKPTTPITSSTRAIKMKFYDYWENFCRGEMPENRYINWYSLCASSCFSINCYWPCFSCFTTLVWNKKNDTQGLFLENLMMILIMKFLRKDRLSSSLKVWYNNLDFATF